MKENSSKIFDLKEVLLVGSTLRNMYEIDVLLVGDNESLPASMMAKWKPGQLKVHKSKRGLLGAICMVSHIFGHLVIFSEHPDLVEFARPVDEGVKPLNLDSSYRLKYKEYEYLASSYGLALILKSLKDINLGQHIAYQAYLEADFEMYWHYVLTGVMPTERLLWAKYIDRFTQLSQLNKEELIKPTSMPRKMNLILKEIIAV